MTAGKVLLVNTAEEEADYLGAVSHVIRNIILENDVTFVQIAKAIDATSKTISNAFNKHNSLCPLYLNRLGKVYGPHVLDPVAKLSGGRMVPIELSMQRDVLPFVARVNLKLANARDPEGPGGAREIHTEKADYLPDLRALRKELDALIGQIEGELAA